MAENLDKWPSKHRKTDKSGHRVAAEGIQFLGGGMVMRFL
jgi:hypothetical protein